MPDQLKVEITLQPKQKEAFYKSLNIPVLFYGGAKGGGKSYLVRAREVYRRLNYPNSKGLIIRKTYPELLSNHIRPMFVEYPMVRDIYNKSEKTIYWPNGSTTEFSYLQNTDDVYTYQGREYDDISIDEITQHEELIFKILRSSNRTTNPLIKPTMLLTGNPGGKGHGWVKRIFINRDFTEGERPADFDFVQAKVWDNDALLFADPKYPERLKDLPPDVSRAYLEGDWDIFSGQVFSEWRRARHVVNFLEWPVSECKKIVGFDWGYNAPGAAVWLALSPDKRVIMYRELYQNRKTPEEWALQLKAFFKIEPFEYIGLPHDCFAKQGGRESIADVFRRAKLPVRRVMTLQKDARKNSLALFHNYLAPLPDGRPGFQVHEKCVNTIRTLPLLIYDDNNVEDVDTTGEDHIYDAIRVGFMSRLEYNVNSGGIKAQGAEKQNELVWKVSEKGNLSAPDFWEAMKSGIKKRDWRYK